MATLAEYGTIRDVGNLPETVTDPKLDSPLKLASIEMKKIIGADKYNAVAANKDTNEDYEELSLAEANLAMSYAVTSLNIETHGTGIARGKGFGDSRSDLLSQNEVERLREYYRGIAMDLLSPYITQPISTDEIPADEVVGSDFRMTAL